MSEGMRIELNPSDPPPPRVVPPGRTISEKTRQIEAGIASKQANEWIAIHFATSVEAKRCQSATQGRRRKDRERRHPHAYPPVATRVIGSTLWVLRLSVEAERRQEGEPDGATSASKEGA